MKKLSFDQHDLIPAIAQDYRTGEIRMLAYMNKAAFSKTIETGYVHYYSRSRQELWKKGETSGNFQRVKAIRTDCDMDALLIVVEQQGVACHTGERNCFFNQYNFDENSWEQVEGRSTEGLGVVLAELEKVIDERYENRPAGSYTTKLFEGEKSKKSVDLILEKVGEETVETLLAAKNGCLNELTQELADLFYHLLVLCRKLGLKLEEVAAVLAERRGEKKDSN